MRKTNIALIGCMGCGKTTVGKLLAAKNGLAFLDTDDKIEEKAHEKIPFIFEHYGESYFRMLESEMIALAADREYTVIATGGGAVLDKRNISALSRTSAMVYLEWPPEELYLHTRGGTRPLLNNTTTDPLERLQGLLAIRSTLYRQAADTIISCTGKSPIEIAEEILC